MLINLAKNLKVMYHGRKKIKPLKIPYKMKKKIKMIFIGWYNDDTKSLHILKDRKQNINSLSIIIINAYY